MRMRLIGYSVTFLTIFGFFTFISIDSALAATCPAISTIAVPALHQSTPDAYRTGYFTGCNRKLNNADNAEAFCIDANIPSPYNLDAQSKEAWMKGCPRGYSKGVALQYADDQISGADTSEDNGNKINLVNPLGENATGITILQKIFKTMREIMYVVVPIFIVIGAFQMMFAAGNPEKFATGQKTILYSVIGLVIIIVASGIVAIVKSLLTV